MAYRVLFKASAAAELAALPADRRESALATIRALAAEPRPAGAARLGERQRYRLALDGGRLLWSVEEEGGRVVVVAVGPSAGG